MSLKSIVGILFFILLFSACTDSAIVRQNKELDPSGWLADEPAEFEFEVKNTDLGVDLFVDLRHNGDYPYRNLFLFLETTFPDGKTERDTIECLLADKLGHWKGTGNGFVFSNGVNHDILFRYNDKFPETGMYKMSFQQAMRVENLEGILDIGLIIRPNVK